MPKVTKDKEAMIKRGNILYELRRERNINQITISNYLGISQQAYLKYEKGDADPTIDALIKIANFYDVPIDYLLGLEPASNPFAEMNLSEEDEEEVWQKYKSFPPEGRAFLLNVLKQLGSVLQHPKNGDDSITCQTNAGAFLDRYENEEKEKALSDAESKNAVAG